MILEILKYEPMWNAHRVRLQDGSTCLVDVCVDGGINFDTDILIEEEWQKLVGRKIECSYIHPFVSVAINVKLLKKAKKNGINV